MRQDLRSKSHSQRRQRCHPRRKLRPSNTIFVKCKELSGPKFLKDFRVTFHFYFSALDVVHLFERPHIKNIMTYSRCRTSCSLSWLALFQKSCQLWALRFDINCILTCMQGLKLAKWNGSELNLEHTSPALREHGEGKMHGRNFCTGRGPPHGIIKNEPLESKCRPDGLMWNQKWDWVKV